MSREISITRTRRFTCTLERTSSSFSTTWSSPRKPRAIASTRWASAAFATVPETTIPRGVVRTTTPPASRRICRIAACTAAAEAVRGPGAAAARGSAGVPPRTVMRYSATAVPSSAVASTVVRPAATPMTKRLVGEAGCTRATLGSAASTVEAGAGRESSRPPPASSMTVWGVAGCA
nr:hypothetical protein [Siccirubricoccus sp. G192]